MSTKKYCDFCDAEMPPGPETRILYGRLECWHMDGDARMFDMCGDCVDRICASAGISIKDMKNLRVWGPDDN